VAVAKVKWLGDGPKTLHLPIPFLSYSDSAGQVTLDPVGEMDDESASNLIQLGTGLFEIVEEGAPAEESAPSEEEQIEPSDAEVIAIYKRRASANSFARKNKGSRVRKHPSDSDYFEVYVPSPAEPEGN